jgi:hypothetical protein
MISARYHRSKLLLRQVFERLDELENRFNLVKRRTGNIERASELPRATSTGPFRDVKRYALSSSSPLVTQRESLDGREPLNGLARQDDERRRFLPGE